MLSFYQGNVPSRESIHVYYQKAMRLNMSRQASIDQISEDESVSGSVRYRRRRGGYRMESQDSTASRDSISRYAMPNNCWMCNTSYELELWSNKSSHQGGWHLSVGYLSQSVG